MTNFQRIAKTPEALAEWLGKHINFCDEFFVKIALTITKLMVAVCDILKQKNGWSGLNRRVNNNEMRIL